MDVAAAVAVAVDVAVAVALLMYILSPWFDVLTFVLYGCV